MLSLLIAVLVLGASLGILAERILGRRKRFAQGNEERHEAGAKSPQKRNRTAKTTNFKGEPFPEFRPDFQSDKHWNPYGQRPPRPEEPATYRVPRGSAIKGPPRWDPYAEEQSRVSRIKAARHRPRASGRVQDYYMLLGLDRDATDEQIERAYRSYASRFHPDRFFDDPVRRAEAEVRLKQLNGAMQVLRDPLRRAKYDSTLS